MFFNPFLLFAIAFVVALNTFARPNTVDDQSKLIRKDVADENTPVDSFANLDRRDKEISIQFCDAFGSCTSPSFNFQAVCFNQQGKTKIKIQKPSGVITLGTYYLASYSTNGCLSAKKIACQNLGIGGISGTATININKPGSSYKIIVGGPFKERDESDDDLALVKRADCGI